jgi:hypothetical protein
MYNPHIYLLQGWGLLCYIALVTKAQIHTNASEICSKLTLPRDHQQLAELRKEV